MTYTLLTGATGLLGRYLLRDLALADQNLAVVVRPTRWESAPQRIETALARWEQELGRSLPRPVVLEGDITEPGLGLSQRDVRWVARHVDQIVHSAASLTFIADEAEGEPYRSNVLGTQNVLELCSRAGIRRSHHVSTAYVCGLRKGLVLESELDVGQVPGNDYETTKIASEKLALESGVFDQVTVHRPSIIVGDSRTGYTTSYHGFYTPLRLLHTIVQAIGWEGILQLDWLGALELAGGEGKNYVPVDWVSAAMTAIIARPELHGTTYHLTNPTPTKIEAMRDAIAVVLAGEALAKPAAPARLPAAELLTSFRDQMGMYQSYWRDDPHFDSSRTEAALPYLPCPTLTHEMMETLVRFAVRSNFGWPREQPLVPGWRAAEPLAPWLAAGEALADEASENAGDLNLDISGAGGGQWRLVFDQGRLVGAEQGLRAGASATCYMTATTFAQLLRGEASVADSIHSGRLVVAGQSAHPQELSRVFRDLAACGALETTSV